MARSSRTCPELGNDTQVIHGSFDAEDTQSYRASRFNHNVQYYTIVF